MPSWSCVRCPCCRASLALARAPDTAFRLLPWQTGVRCHDARQHCHIKGAPTSRPLARAAPSRREGRLDGKRILKSGSSRGGFAGSRGHDSSKEVNHGSFAPRTSQIHAELAEIDHARHQNGEVSDAHSGEADIAIQGTFSVAHETRRGPAGYLHHDCRVLVLAALPSLTHIFLQPRRQPSKCEILCQACGR